MTIMVGHDNVITPAMAAEYHRLITERSLIRDQLRIPDASTPGLRRAAMGFYARRLPVVLVLVVAAWAITGGDLLTTVIAAVGAAVYAVWATMGWKKEFRHRWIKDHRCELTRRWYGLDTQIHTWIAEVGNRITDAGLGDLVIGSSAAYQLAESRRKESGAATDTGALLSLKREEMRQDDEERLYLVSPTGVWTALKLTDVDGDVDLVSRSGAGMVR